MVIATTSSSFRNQTSPSTHGGVTAGISRNRGISLLLQDVSNVCEEPQTCRARLQTKKSIKSHSSCLAPCGNPAKGTKVQHSPATSTPACESPVTLTQLMHDTVMIRTVMESLLLYTQRNTCIFVEKQKAVAITIMTTTMSKWGCNIGYAASCAADCIGFNTESERKWAFTLFTNGCS